MHFDGSHLQVTLHTCVLYVLQNDPISSLSDCHRKDRLAIWAYLDPVLNKFRSEYPNVYQIHFFSDGSTTQYRQKKNFYLLSTILGYGFEFEYSH